MPTYIPIRSIALFAVLGLAAQAQSPKRPAAGSDDVVTLEEFSVKASSASEYAAAESVTGTRVAIKLQDMPFSVNVVTGEFLDDFAAFEFRDQFGYTSSVSVWETLSTGYSLRGFDADVQLRNGFRRIGLIDKVNVDRAEVIKGPAASIYGAVLPGGTINIITKKPKKTPAHRIAVTAGTNNLLRAQASSTGPVGSSDTWFYRIDVANDESEYDQAFKKRQTKTVVPQLMWKPNANTSVHFEFEWLERAEDGISSAIVPFVIQSGTPDPYRVSTQNRTYNRYTGIAMEVFDFNSQGPLNYSDRDVKTANVTLEHRISSTWSLRSAANWFDRGLERQEVGGRDQFNPSTRRLQRGTPRLRPFGEGGAGWQTDLLGSFTTGSVQHKTLFTFDYQHQWETPERYDMTNFAAGMPAEVQSGISVDSPSYAFVTYAQDPSLYTMSQKEANVLDLYGAFVNHRAIFFNGKANLMGGARIDRVDGLSRDLRAGTESSRRSYEHSYQIGGNYSVVQGLAVFINKSASFVPQFRIGRNADGSTYEIPSEKGQGWEAGLKGSLLQDRLTFTATYFDITRDNVARDVTESGTGLQITVLSGKEASKGFELDFNYVATPELQFFGGYGYTNSEVVSHAQAPHLEGSPLRRAPRHNVGVGTKYQLKEGKLKGLYLTAGYKAYGRSIANPSTGRSLTASSSNPIVNNPMPNGRLPFPNLPAGAVVTSGTARVDDGRESIYNRTYDVVEAGIGYRWKTGRFAHKLQANATNLWDIRYTYGSTGHGAGRNYLFTYDLNF